MSDINAPPRAAPFVRCAACRLAFSIASFPIHRIGRDGQRRCLSELELRGDGFELRGGVWALDRQDVTVRDDEPR